MARIKVLGGTGYGGSAVVREAVRRKHTVTSYSRRPPAEPIVGVEYVTGSALEPSLRTRRSRTRMWCSRPYRRAATWRVSSKVRSTS